MAETRNGSSLMLEYNRIKKQVDSFSDAAKAIRLESNRLGDHKADLEQAWQGENAGRFTGKMSLASEELAKIAAQLEAVSDEIHKKAKSIYDSEMGVMEK